LFDRPTQDEDVVEGAKNNKPYQPIETTVPWDTENPTNQGIKPPSGCTCENRSDYQLNIEHDT
jgi:hypothetical protein